MSTTLWKGHITFGFIVIPVHLQVAARDAHTHFHEIHRECGTRIHHQLYCPYDRRVVARDEVALGYETSKDNFVLIDPTELKQIQPRSSKVMEILQFVTLSDVDPIFFESSYFAAPEEGGKRAFALLVKTMEQMGLAAIAKMTLHRRERAVAIRPYRQGLAIHTMFADAGRFETRR